ncbi:MAG TPA: hypothetical protein VK149_02315 [Sideroxyarcus sp.]|nr:hypothetical protein [Sideroxyarcus sp.]
MIRTFRLPASLRAFGTADFESTLQQELAQHASALPLQQGLTQSNQVVDGPISVLVRSVSATDGGITVKVGIFYQGVLGGCSCAGDPTPASENSEYCEVQLLIDRSTADVAVSLLD